MGLLQLSLSFAMTLMEPWSRDGFVLAGKQRHRVVLGRPGFLRVPTSWFGALACLRSRREAAVLHSTGSEVVATCSSRGNPSRARAKRLPPH